MQIFVKTFANARTIALDVETSTTIKQAKCQLNSRLGLPSSIPSSKQRLLHGGKELDDDCTFADYGTRNEDSFRLALSGLAGGGASSSRRKYSVNVNKQLWRNPGTHKAIGYALDLLSTHILGNEKLLSLMDPELELESQEAIKALAMLVRIPPRQMNILHLNQLCDFLGHMSSAVPADMAEFKQKLAKALFKLTRLSGQVPSQTISKVVSSAVLEPPESRVALQFSESSVARAVSAVAIPVAHARINIRT